MSGGDSNDFKGDSDDLLSQLLDLEDVISQPGSAERDNKSAPDKTEILGDADRNDRTEVLSADSLSDEKDDPVALDSFLKDDTDISSSEDVEFFTDQIGRPPQDAKTEVKDPSFEEELEHTILEQAKPLSENPFDEPKRDKTLVLDTPVEESPDESQQASFDKTDFISKEDVDMVLTNSPVAAQEDEEPSSSGSLDPIEAALAEFSSEQGDDLSAAAISSVRPKEEAKTEPEELEVEDLFNDPPPSPAHKAEVSQEDFADVFQSGPIQVPQQKVKSSPRLSVSSKKLFAKAAGILIVLGALGFGGYRIFSESGLFGYRIEGFGLEAVYRPPSSEELQIIKEKISKAQQARLLDDPQEIEAQISVLENILQQDERNLEAAYELLELSGLMIAWKGIQTVYPSKYESALQKVQFIEQKLKNPPPHIQKLRAKAWRSLEVGESTAAISELEQFASQNNLMDESTKSLIGEFYYRRGDLDKAKSILSSVPPSHRRARFFLALSSNDRETLTRLAQDLYLPAKVETESADEGRSFRENVSRLDELLEKVKDYPWLAARVQGKLGDLYQSVGEGAKAREYWKAIVTKSPDDFHTWQKLARSYKEDSEWEDSLNAYRAAIKAGGLQKETALQFVQLLRMRLKVVEALDVIDQALQKYPNAPQFYYEKGETQLAIYQDEPAKLSFQKAIEIEPNFEPAILSLAQLAVKQRDLDRARELFLQISEKSPNYSRALMGLGRLAMSKREFKEAQRYFALSIKTNPKNEDAYDYLVRLLLREEQDHKALAMAEESVRVLPKSPVAHLSKARVLLFQNQFDLAESEIQQYLSSHNHYLPLVLLHVEILIEKGDYHKARQILEQHAANEASEPEILYFKALLNYKDEGADATSPVIGSKEAAWRQIQAAISFSPDNERYLALQAKIAFALDERVQAFEIAERLLSFYPANPTGYEVQGDVHFVNGAYEQALRSYQKAQSLTRFKGGLYRKIASVYRNQGQSAKAIQYYLKLVEWYPSDALAFQELGKLYNEDGRYARALEAFRRASQLRPNMPEPYYYMGFIQKETGDYKNAVRNFERYLSLDPNGIEAATVKDEIYFLKNGTTSN